VTLGSFVIGDAWIFTDQAIENVLERQFGIFVVATADSETGNNELTHL
jgi:hypothetical protein